MRSTYSTIFGCAILFFAGADIARSGELFIEYSSYLGGNASESTFDFAYTYGGIAVDSKHCAYVAGTTQSYNFPTRNAYQGALCGQSDAFIAKVSSSGSILAYSTHFGGSNSDRGCRIAIDSTGCTYIVGFTRSSDYPTLNPYQSSISGWSDLFLAKIVSSGSSLAYSTYIGGDDGSYGAEYPYNIALDTSNRAYITGMVGSTAFPTHNPYQPSYGGASYMYEDAFVMCVGSSGSHLVYSTYLGGMGREEGRGIAVDAQNFAYVVGLTNSYDFPTVNAYQVAMNDDIRYQGFVTKFAPSGSAIEYSTFIGGSDFDFAYGIDVDSEYHAYIAGHTMSTDYPTCNAYQPSSGYWSGRPYGDCFVSKLSSSGSSLRYSTYLGGSYYDAAFDIIVDGEKRACITGYTESSDFPTLGAYQGAFQAPWYARYSDIFVTRFSSSGTMLSYSTYLGGRGEDAGRGIAIDSSDRIYVMGYTKSYDFPTRNAFLPKYRGNIDACLAKLRYAPSPTPFSPGTILNGGDYNGDGVSEISVFRPDTGIWQIKNVGCAYFGRGGDTPVSGDYDGDGTTDIAIFRPGEGLWAIRNLTRFNFGSSADIPLPRDYDRDGKTDAAIFRPGHSLWSIRDLTVIYFGREGDVPVPADYDGDGLVDAAVYRSPAGLWMIRGLAGEFLGTTGDIPMPADYNQDGKTETAVFRPATGLWAGALTGEGLQRIYLGISGDIPVPASYGGGDWIQPAVFRSSSGLWAVHDLTRCWFGMPGDVPVAH